VTIASIDIGTNTVLLLIARVGPDGSISPLVYEQRIPRLGKGVDAEKRLEPASMRRVIAVLKEYADRIQSVRPEAVVVCGTSAVRDAANRQQFTAMVLHETGFRLEVLSGDEEAHWTYRGAISGVPGISLAAVLDIGGGSTEISCGNRQALLSRKSMNIGSVRLTERLFRHDPPSQEEIATGTGLIRTALEKDSISIPAGSTLVGVAGTATSLAMMAQGMQEFSIAAVTNYLLQRSTVEHLFATLRRLPAAEIQALSPIMEGRADVITAGTLILLEMMNHYGFDVMTVSERGVRYGLVLREWERRIKEKEIRS
jgi:exopolyphosphatase/guanosine-5'-triphosphate,3'-diphosphate pyrophosphatase